MIKEWLLLLLLLLKPVLFRDEDISIHGLTGYVVRKDASSSEIESDEDDLFELDSSEEEED